MLLKLFDLSKFNILHLVCFVDHMIKHHVNENHESPLLDRRDVFVPDIMRNLSEPCAYISVCSNCSQMTNVVGGLQQIKISATSLPPVNLYYPSYCVMVEYRRVFESVFKYSSKKHYQNVLFYVIIFRNAMSFFFFEHYVVLLANSFHYLRHV